MIEVQSLCKDFQSQERKIRVLDSVSFTINAGETTAIVGPSGSGKTTLLGIAAGLDDPTEGRIQLKGQFLDEMNEEERARFRNQYIGFVFQNFQLISTLTAEENVMVPADLMGQADSRQRAQRLLEQVGLSHRMDHYPGQLSGGEQQRVALARAFINQPQILFADEPTGNLDAENSSRIEELMFSLNKQYGTTLVIVTHDLTLAEQCDRVVFLKGGKVEDIRWKERSTEIENSNVGVE
jgi:putative ABC transport system ATP-binding protein